MNEPLGPLALVLLAIPAIALRLAVRALYGQQRLAAADPMQSLLSLSSTILFIVSALGLLIGLLGGWFMILPVAIASVVLLLMTIDRMRRSEHRALLWSLSAAAEKGVPLAEAARAYSDESLGDTGVRALALAEALERGETLDQAVRSARLWMGTAMKLAVRLGERLGMLGPAMRQQLQDTHLIDTALRNAVARVFYLCAVIYVLVTISTFVMLKIVPVMQKMFDEFGLELPAPTVFVIKLAKWLVDVGWIFVLPPLALLLPILFGLGLMHFLGLVPRNIPFWWLLFKRYDGALVMRGLALAVRQRRPLPEAFRLVADSYPLSIVAGRLRRAAERVEAGQNWCESLQRTGLIGPAEAPLLAAAERAGNLDWALEEMADSALRRQTYRLQAVISVLFPMLLVVVALVVFVFVVGMFMPLISLIQGLT